MDKRWKRNVVFLMSFVMAVMHLPISCVSSMAILWHVPAVSMAKWVENVSAGQFGVHVHLIRCCLIGCCTGLSSCAISVGLIIVMLNVKNLAGTFYKITGVQVRS